MDKSKKNIMIFHTIIYGSIAAIILYIKFVRNEQINKKIWDLIITLVIAKIIYKVAMNEKFKNDIASK